MAASVHSFTLSVPSTLARLTFRGVLNMPQTSSSTPFSGIFVSYRRDDTSGHAGRLFDKLVSHFGRDRIFMDIDTIEPGEDFVSVIEDAVGSCDLLIAVISTTRG